MAHTKQKYSGLWTPESTHEKIDSQKMFIDNLNQHEVNYADLIKRIHTKVDSITELRSIDVSSEDSTIGDGTLILVIGVGVYYYNINSTSVDDGEEIIKPDTGSGRWLLAGGGGGNLIVDDEDYGEDTDSDTGIVIKIKKLFNKKLKLNFFPLTTTKAVRDTTLNKTLYELLNIIPQMDEESEVVEGAESIDADTLGGRYTAEDLDAMPKSTAIEDYANVEPPIIDADSLGGKYTKEDIEALIGENKKLSSNLSNTIYKSDIAIVSGTITAPNTWQIIADYPSGFTFENTVVLSCYITDDSTHKQPLPSVNKGSYTRNGWQFGPDGLKVWYDDINTKVVFVLLKVE